MPAPNVGARAHRRRQGAQEIAVHERFTSLDALFPRSGLGEAFDTDAVLRRAIRVATRTDLFATNPRWSDAANAAVRGLHSTLVMDWRLAERGMPQLDAAFAAAGVALRGADFILGLGALCGGGADAPAGSLTDIVHNGRSAVAHSWHQDSGLFSNTVMVAFADRDCYAGAGVFSHAVRLSHALRVPGQAGAVIEWERSFAEGEAPPVAEELVVRPGSGRGKEVMVYCDAALLHSAPDKILRDAVWRFM